MNDEFIEWCVLRSCIEYPRVAVGAQQIAAACRRAYVYAWYTAPNGEIILIWSDD